MSTEVERTVAAHYAGAGLHARIMERLAEAGVPAGAVTVEHLKAVDAAVQSKKLGAEQVSFVYRRSRARVGASGYEQELAANAGVRIICDAMPVAVKGNGRAQEVEFAYTAEGPDGLRPTGETFALGADQVLTAIGQRLADGIEGLTLAGGKIVVEGAGRTSLPGVWAGGDCASGGDDLTVTAVAEGRDAAMDIDAALTAKG